MFIEQTNEEIERGFRYTYFPKDFRKKRKKFSTILSLFLNNIKENYESHNGLIDDPNRCKKGNKNKC